MSSNSTNSTVPNFNGTIKRFTFDWLIRFIELHPPHRSSFPKAWRLSDYFRPSESYLSCISPSFTALIQKYLPTVYNRLTINIDEDECQDAPTLKSKKPLIITSSNLVASNCTAGAIETVIKTPIYFNNLSIVSMNESSFTLDELKCVLTGCEIFYAHDSKFAEPVTFSELWPLLTYCYVMELDILNMIYDENIGQTMQKYRGIRPKCIKFYNLPMTENILMSIIDYVLSFSEFPRSVTMFFPVEIAPSKLQLFLHNARRRMEHAGFKCEDTDDHIEFKYDDLHNKIPLLPDIKHIIVHTLYGQDETRLMFTSPFCGKFVVIEPSSDSSEEGSLSDND